MWTYIVLTEPLTDAQLDAIGWAGREGVEDFRDLVHYYRLTADNRLLIGGRDVGALATATAWPDSRRDDLRQPCARTCRRSSRPWRDVRFTHAWGGPVSATLDMFPALGYVGGRDWRLLVRLRRSRRVHSRTSTGRRSGTSCSSGTPT